MSGTHSVENTNNEKIEKPNISNPTAFNPTPPQPTTYPTQPKYIPNHHRPQTTKHNT
ncbi:hypothetical protein BD0047_01280 [Helicobacter pylori]